MSRNPTATWRPAELNIGNGIEASIDDSEDVGGIGESESPLQKYTGVEGNDISNSLPLSGLDTLVLYESR